jgi:8-oxo-dGTP pyrophosphatase MutT (NUDIX family)
VVTGIPSGRPEHRGDGDGWVVCGQGHRHWGLFGAAGLLLTRPGVGRSGDGPADLEVLLQHRATWSHHGGTWGLLGGARHRSESPVTAALREAAEEGGLSPDAVQVHGRYDDDHGGWSYATVVATTGPTATATPTSPESIAVEWVLEDEVDRRDLHPGFGASWPELRTALRPVTVVVDAANVVGSRPDGWWRDRAGATRRLLTQCAALAREGLAAADVPHGLAGSLVHSWPTVVVVVEGAARAAAHDAPDAVRVVGAPGSGDDTIVDVAGAAAVDGPTVVVTADGELRERVSALGATTAGPRWLTGLLDGAPSDDT